jgi:hypothetical protein
LGERELEFSLTYDGPLPSCPHNKEESKSDYKQNIRLEFAEQLARHWNGEPMLRNWKRQGLPLVSIVNRRAEVPPLAVNTNPHFVAEMCGYGWTPLITRTNGLVCELSILLKRRSDPGELIVSGNDGGDLDNRLKILFDALRMPLSEREVPGNMWGPGSDDRQRVDLVVLLEDDSLISKVTIEARRLNTVPKPDQRDDYAEVDVQATVKCLHPTAVNRGYVG